MKANWPICIAIVAWCAIKNLIPESIYRLVTLCTRATNVVANPKHDALWIPSVLIMQWIKKNRNQSNALRFNVQNVMGIWVLIYPCWIIVLILFIADQLINSKFSFELDPNAHFPFNLFQSIATIKKSATVHFLR